MNKPNQESRYIIILCLMTISLLTYSQTETKKNGPNSCGKLNVKVNKKELPESLEMTISFRSTSNTVLKVPQEHRFKVGFENDEDADSYFEVFDITNDSITRLTSTTDYQYLPAKSDELQKVKKRQRVLYYFNLCRFYLLDPSRKYKFRMIFKISKYNSATDIYSDWIIL